MAPRPHGQLHLPAFPERLRIALLHRLGAVPYHVRYVASSNSFPTAPHTVSTAPSLCVGRGC